MNRFTEKMLHKSDKELQDYVFNRHRYEVDAIVAALEEMKKRKVVINDYDMIKVNDFIKNKSLESTQENQFSNISTKSNLGPSKFKLFLFLEMFAILLSLIAMISKSASDRHSSIAFMFIDDPTFAEKFTYHFVGVNIFVAIIFLILLIDDSQ
jgi:hypothetical protein